MARGDSGAVYLKGVRHMKKKNLILLAVFLIVFIIVFRLSFTKNNEKEKIVVTPAATAASTSSPSQTPQMSKSAGKQFYVGTAQGDLPFKNRKDSQGLCFEPVRDIEGEYEYNGELAVYAEELTTDKVVIPDTFEGLKVVEISWRGFSNNEKITSITMGKNIRKIGVYAFDECVNLLEVKFKENSLKRIGHEAFRNCRSLKEININGKVKFLAKGTFEDCIKLRKVTLCDGIETIEENCFKDCSSMKEITLPKKLKTIEKDAFNECSQLKNVFLKGETYDISEKAFTATPFESKYRNKGKCFVLNGILLEIYDDMSGDITIDGNGSFAGHKIHGIAGRAFKKNKKLGKVTIKNIRTIAGKAFYRCKADSFQIQNIELITENAFDYAKASKMSIKNIGRVDNCFQPMNMKEIYVDGIKKLDYCSFPKKVEKITLKGIKKCWKYAINLRRCKNLKELTLEGNLQQFTYDDFAQDCVKLKSCVIKSTDNIIWKHESYPFPSYWFKKCRKLKDVYLQSTAVSEKVEKVFPEWITLHVPAEQVEEYEKYVECKVVAW